MCSKIIEQGRPLINRLRKIKNKYINYKQTQLLKNNKNFSKLFDKTFAFDVLSNQEHMELILDWFLMAQENSIDKGIPAKINLNEYILHSKDYYPSYPETTGYIVPTLLNAREYSSKIELEIIHEMIEFLLTIQNEDGGFNAHAGISDIEKKSYAFDTGQILCGLVAYYKHVDASKKVEKAITAASNWMVSNIDIDGSYKLNACFNGKKCYYSRATIGLALAAVLFNNDEWKEATHRQVSWVIAQQNELAWFNHYSFDNGKWSNMHGIAYTLRGVLECGYLLNNEIFINSTKRAVDKIISCNCDGLPFGAKVPNSFTEDYKEYDNELCLTGMAQLAIICFKLSKIFNDKNYFDFGKELLEVLKKTHFRGFEDQKLNGVLPGSWPINGKYQSFDLPNWPIKFFLDGLMIVEGLDPMKVEG